MKKIIISLLLFMTILLVGCKSKNTTSTTKTENETLKFAFKQNKVSLNVGSSYDLETENARENTIIFYTVRDEGIVSIEEGHLTAIGVGETTITAQCGSETALCLVTVSNYVPKETLSVMLQKEEYTIYKGQSFTLDPIVKVGDEIITDYDASLVAENTEILSISALTLQGSSQGTTKLKMTFSYNGETVEKLITINVVEGE